MKIAIVNDVLRAIEAMCRGVESSSQHPVARVPQERASAVNLRAEEPCDRIWMDAILPLKEAVEAPRRVMAPAPCLIMVVQHVDIQFAPSLANWLVAPTALRPAHAIPPLESLARDAALILAPKRCSP